MKNNSQNSLSIFLISICFLTSCSLKINDRHNVQAFDDFPITTNLFHEKIITDSILYSVGGLLLLDSVLISVDFKADTFFQVFKLPSFEYIGGFITKGSGPEEEIYIDPFIGRVSNNEFLFKGASSISFAKYNNNSNNLEITTRINLPDNLMEIWNPIKLGDSIISNKTFSLVEKEYIGYNIKNKEQFDFGSDYPSVGKKIDPLLKGMVFAKANVVKPDGSAFACVYDKFPIWNWDGEPIKRILLDENIFAFDVDSHDNYIIASSLLSIDTFYKYNLK